MTSLWVPLFISIAMTVVGWLAERGQRAIANVHPTYTYNRVYVYALLFFSNAFLWAPWLAPLIHAGTITSESTCGIDFFVLSAFGVGATHSCMAGRQRILVADRKTVDVPWRRVTDRPAAQRVAAVLTL
jgi:hypothetical protein